MPSSLFGPSQSPTITSPMPSRQIPAMGTPPANPQANIQPPANIAQIKNLMNVMNAAANPQAIMQSFIASNPLVGTIMNLVNNYGGDAKKAFYDTAAQMGVDPNQIINWLK